MQQMYEDYKGVAEFRIVYINEAHPTDGRRPVGYAEEQNITKHTSYAQRCDVAEKMLSEKNLAIPCIIDKMDNKVSEAYKAHPDRLFLVRRDGRLGVAGKRGPWGFKPAFGQARTWLTHYAEKGEDPPLDIVQDSTVASDTSRPRPRRASARTIPEIEKILGVWEMETTLSEDVIDATMSLSVQDSYLVGVWKSRGREMDMIDLEFDGATLSFRRSMGGGPTLDFKGTVEGETVSGTYTGPFGELECSGKRIRAAQPVQSAAEETDAPKMSAMDRRLKIAELTQDMLRLAAKGEDDQALQAALGALEQAEAFHRESGEPAARLLSMTNYNVACMYSRMKRLDESFDYLHAAIKLVDFGEDLSKQIEQDPDFDNIRGDPRYTEMMKKVEKE